MRCEFFIRCDDEIDDYIYTQVFHHPNTICRCKKKQNISQTEIEINILHLSVRDGVYVTNKCIIVITCST